MFNTKIEKLKDPWVESIGDKEAIGIVMENVFQPRNG